MSQSKLILVCAGNLGGKDNQAAMPPLSSGQSVIPEEAARGVHFVELVAHPSAGPGDGGMTSIVDFTPKKVPSYGCFIWCCGGRHRGVSAGAAWLHVTSDGSLWYAAYDARGNRKSISSNAGAVVAGRRACVVVRHNAGGQAEILLDGKCITEGYVHHPDPTLWTDRRMGCTTPAFANWDHYQPWMSGDVWVCAVLQRCVTNEEVRRLVSCDTDAVWELVTDNALLAVNPAAIRSVRYAAGHLMTGMLSLVKRGRASVDREQPGWSLWEMVFGTGEQALPEDLQRKVIMMMVRMAAS